MAGVGNVLVRRIFVVILQLVMLAVTIRSAVVDDDPGSGFRCRDRGHLHRGTQRIFQRGSYIIYQCDSGFTLLGSNIVRCLPTGRWNMPKPLCVGSGCEVTKKIKNGSEKKVHGGNIIQYQCHNGYVLRGSATIYCDGEHWNDTVPECLGTGFTSYAPVSSCPDIGQVRNARREVYEVDGAVIFRCNVGFDIIGSPAVRCQRNGEWTTSKPVCSRNGCTPLPEITNGFKQILHHGRVTQYKCYSQYTLRGSNVIYCDGTRWNDTAPRCVLPGDEPEDPTETSNDQSDKTVHVQTSTVQQNNEANESILKVEGGTNCQPAARQPHSIFRYHQRRDGYGNLYYVVVYECNNGHELLEGELELYCSNRQWVGTYPVCGTVNPCAVNNGGCEHRCEVRENGQAKCSCSLGYQLRDGGRCTDVNECLANRGRGPCSHICINRQAGFMCVCPQGYELMDDKVTCQALSDPCQENNGGCSHICRHINLRPYCACPVGYRLGYDRKTCQDVNECAEGRGYCYNGGCENTPGSYRCTCSAGFYTGANGQCTDMNECTVRNGACSHGCRNTWGSYNCDCPRGYELSEDRHTCKDIDECKNPYYYRQCPYGCENTDGSFHCLCPSGFTASNGINCVDIDECEVNSGRGPCQDKCVNKPGSYVCLCSEPGFTLAADGIQCEDVDECQVEGTCHHNCHNLPGSYQCTCNNGYLILPDKKTCEGCRVNAYKSTWANECIDCPANSHTDGTAKTSLSDCICNTGFHGNPSADLPCEDINECDIDNNGCSDLCVNTPGSAFCACPVGFTLEDGKFCVDLDECVQNNGGCEHRCQNTEGSFACSCKDGYALDEEDPYICTDIDECQQSNGGCAQRCVNFPGGYRCECNGQSVMAEDGQNCEAVVCSALAIPSSGKVRPRGVCIGVNRYKPLTVGTVCSFQCLKGHVLEGSEKRICENNGRWSGTEAVCKPVRCQNIVPPEFGKVLPSSCHNSGSDYQSQCIFSCNEGYELVGTKTVKCQHTGIWSDEPPTCVQEAVEPTITCSGDLTFELSPGAAFIITSIPSPVANVDNVQVNRETQNTAFYPGTTDVHFVAISDDGSKKATCIVSVHVIDTEPPKILFCPEDFRVETSDPSQIYWEEPRFSDNVGIVEQSNSKTPGGEFTYGQYNVVYSAKDAANNIAECKFKVSIDTKACGDPDGPLNGHPGCVDWLYGRICDPACDQGYTFYTGKPTSIYICGANATWAPSRKIPDCSAYTPVTSVDEECSVGSEMILYLEESDSPACVECPRGMFLERKRRKCTPCYIGYYQDELGKSQCKRCPRGSSTEGKGSIGLEQCTDLFLDEEYTEYDTSGDSITG